MRLICPNCDAQYEVPDEVIPAGGRDVQCSSCSQTWFFNPSAEAEAPPAPEPAAAAEPAAPAAPPADDGAGPRRRIDPAVADVLREEAAYEERARASDQVALETQTELGLDDGDQRAAASQRAAEARARMARVRGETAAPQEPQAETSGSRTANVAAGAAAAAVAAEGTRRGLLPDVEEINSTLRSDEDRVSPQETQEPHREMPRRKRGGFSRGFLYILILFTIGATVYIYATDIAEAVPQASPYLDQFVSLVDQGREWLDAQVLMLLEKLDGLTGG